MGDKPFAEVVRCDDGTNEVRIDGWDEPLEFSYDSQTANGFADHCNTAVAALVAAARKEEREKIANMCLAFQFIGGGDATMLGQNIAAAIRALGE